MRAEVGYWVWVILLDLGFGFGFSKKKVLDLRSRFSEQMELNKMVEGTMEHPTELDLEIFPTTAWILWGHMTLY